jgi:hypothetical protein
MQIFPIPVFGEFNFEPAKYANGNFQGTIVKKGLKWD